MSRPLENLVGRQFGRWTVLKFHGYHTTSGQRRSVWWCRCECGKQKAVQRHTLASGSSKGCYPCGRKNLKIPQAVLCSHGCGAKLLRATHHKQAVCPKCGRSSMNSRRGEVTRLLREQARRYRIILHVLGWEPEQFKEMLDEMKESPMSFRDHPETREAKIDIATEQRAARDAARRKRWAEEARDEAAGIGRLG